jgi:hypothetical protein
MTRRTVEAFHRVPLDKFEKRRILFFNGSSDLVLLRRRRIRKAETELLPAHQVCLCDAFVVRIAMPPVVTGKLTIDVAQHSCLGCARKFIRRDDLIAEYSQCACLLVGQDLPGSSVAGNLAACGNGRATRCPCRNKLPACKKLAPFATPHRHTTSKQITTRFGSADAHLVMLNASSEVGLCF